MAKEKRKQTPAQLANLRPIPFNQRTEEDRKRINKMAIEAREKKRKERKLMNERYAEFLLQTHKVKIGKKEVVLTAEEIINRAIAGNLLKTGTTASVAMLKEIRESEGTEGGQAGAKKDNDLLAALLGAGKKEQEGE